MYKEYTRPSVGLILSVTKTHPTYPLLHLTEAHKPREIKVVSSLLPVCKLIIIAQRLQLIKENKYIRLIKETLIDERTI